MRVSHSEADMFCWTIPYLLQMLRVRPFPEDLCLWPSVTDLAASSPGDLNADLGLYQVPLVSMQP